MYRYLSLYPNAVAAAWQCVKVMFVVHIKRAVLVVKLHHFVVQMRDIVSGYARISLALDNDKINSSTLGFVEFYLFINPPRKVRSDSHYVTAYILVVKAFWLVFSNGEILASLLFVNTFSNIWVVKTFWFVGRNITLLAWWFLLSICC